MTTYDTGSTWKDEIQGEQTRNRNGNTWLRYFDIDGIEVTKESEYYDKHWRGSRNTNKEKPQVLEW